MYFTKKRAQLEEIKNGGHAENGDAIYIPYFLEFDFWLPVRYHFMAILVPFVIPKGRKRGKNGGHELFRRE